METDECWFAHLVHQQRGCDNYISQWKVRMSQLVFIEM